MDAAIAQRSDAIESLVIALRHNCEAATHRLAYTYPCCTRDGREAVDKRNRLYPVHDCTHGRVIGGSNNIEVKLVVVGNGGIAEAQMIAGDDDPASCVMIAGFATARSVGHIEAVIAAIIAAAWKGETDNGWLREAIGIGNEDADRDMRRHA